MSGRAGDRESNYGRRGSGPPDYYRPPPPGDYFPGGGPGYGPPPPGYGSGSGRDFRGGPGPMMMPPRGRYNDRGPGPPPPLPRRPGPPGLIVFRSYEEERDWVEERRRKRLARPSKFDVMPASSDQQQLAGTAVVSLPRNDNNNDNSWGYNNNTNNFPQQLNLGPVALPPILSVAPPQALADSLPQQTRHARRLYVGNLPPHINEEQIHRVFRDAIQQALVTPPSGDQPFDVERDDPILSVYINYERRFCFLEFKSVELCSACMAFDGLVVVAGQQPVKVKRPNDYNASLAPKQINIPELDVSRLGIISPTVLDGPNKIFIGGLHYHMTESQVLELLQAFGKVKAFHLVKNDPDSATSKGYCFVEYSDHSLTPTVVASLNGMDIGGGKSITARLAGERHGTVAPILTPTNTPMVPVPPIVHAQQIQQQAQAFPIAGQPSAQPDRNIVGGYDVELLVDAALGKCPMPTGPTHFDGFGQPLTRIVQVIPQPIAVPALTPQQQFAINALPSLTTLPQVMNVNVQPPTMPRVSMNGGMMQPSMLPPMPQGGMNVVMQPPMQPMQTMMTNTVPALTPQQQAAVNALSMFQPVSGGAFQQAPPQPTRVLVLHNMVTDEDLATEEDHAALLEEIKEECMKFGTLQNILVPREVSPGLIEASAIRKVYLEYATVEDALKAESELAGRQFGPNVVNTGFFSEDDFAAGRLS